jgi:HK97 family phage prohead protease
MERRYFKSETRAVGDGDFPAEIAGVGAVVGITTDLGYCEEEIAVGAFAEADLSDVLICFNHDLDTILGRTIAGTAEVTTNEGGNLVYTANKLDNLNPEIQAPIRYIQRGEVSKSSFMFEINEEIWNDSPKYGSFGKRTITKIGKVYECGPVTLPAYNETESYAREKDTIMQSRSKWVEINQTPTDHLIDDEAEREAEWRAFYELTVK